MPDRAKVALRIGRRAVMGTLVTALSAIKGANRLRTHHDVLTGTRAHDGRTIASCAWRLCRDVCQATV
jgi:hypothetical protein